MFHNIFSVAVHDGGNDFLGRGSVLATNTEGLNNQSDGFDVFFKNVVNLGIFIQVGSLDDMALVSRKT